MSDRKLAWVEVSETQIRCCRPPKVRIAFGVIGLIIGAACLYPLIFHWPSAGGIATLVLGGCTTPCLYWAGPADLIVDLDRRMYRFRRGFPFFTDWQEGPITDIADLRMQKRWSESGSVTYQLVLDWRDSVPSPWMLGNGPTTTRRSF